MLPVLADVTIALMRVHTAGYHRQIRHRRRNLKLPFGAQRLLALLEGIEGGFAIGAGLLAGMSLATSSRQLLFLTAAVTMIVNGANSAAIKYAAEHYTDELDGREKNPIRYYLWPAIYEFVAYLVVTAIVLSPLLFMQNVTQAAALSCFATVVVLFAAGYWRGYLMRRHHKLRDGLELSLLALLIIAVGIGSALALNYIRL